MSRLPFVILQNTSSLDPDMSGVLDLQGDVSKEMTFLVTVSGSPSSFSLDLKGGHAAGPIVMYYPLLTVTEPGWYTVDANYVRYVTAALTAITGGSSPTVSVTVAVPDK